MSCNTKTQRKNLKGEQDGMNVDDKYRTNVVRNKWKWNVWKIRNSRRPQTNALQLCRFLSWSKDLAFTYNNKPQFYKQDRGTVTGLFHNTICSFITYSWYQHLLIVYFNAFFSLFVLWLHTCNYISRQKQTYFMGGGRRRRYEKVYTRWAFRKCSL